MNKVDYHDAMNQLFSDKTKFKTNKNDPTLTRLKTVQNYLNNLCKRNEIIEAEKKQMRPMSAVRLRTRFTQNSYSIRQYSQISTISVIIITTAHYK